MGIGATSTPFIPVCSWRRAQRCPVYGFRIGSPVVEDVAIEFRISSDKRPLSGGGRTPWILVYQGHTLYWHVAGVEPNDVQVTDPKSVL